ncbi:ABC transporter ATP-binding protein [Sphingorhabdus contaminans]|uniref:ABC transporter ATP-binding protein n=1 Tax=Sphingorhabdus contaminans TaxID=1343899 RepID=UPI003D2C837B
MLELSTLEVGYAGLRGRVLEPLTLSIAPGSFVCVLGRNGAGKSTLMRTIAGLQPALAGVARLGEVDVTTMTAADRARQIAVVLTERPVSPGLTVSDVVLLGRQPFTNWHGRFSDEDRAIAANAISQAGATAFTARYFDDLSDGERQRVMIARALAQSPHLMILDEITAFLDLPGRVEVMGLLRRKARESGCVVLLSSHDLELSLQLADIVWLLDGKNSLVTGTPATLVGSGCINHAFDSEMVQFSSRLGRFELVDQ